MGCCTTSSYQFIGSYRNIPDKEKNTRWGQNDYFSYGASQMCGWRGSMEDAILVSCPTQDGSDVSLFGVFDGHGGFEISTYLSENLVKWLHGCPDFKEKNYAESLKNNFMNIDNYLASEEGSKEIQEIKLRNSKKKSAWKSRRQCFAGSTAVVVLVTPEQIYVAHTGDSKAVIFANSDIVFATTDHKPHFPGQLKRISCNGGYVEEERIGGDLSVSRGFGDFHYKSGGDPEQDIVSSVPEIRKFKRDQVQLIMMGCDGIWEDKQPITIIESINKKLRKLDKKNTLSNSEKLAYALQQYFQQNIAHHEHQRSGKDNMSAILIQFQSK